MAYKVNFKEGQVETTGLESSPVAESLAGLRANEARYFWNKYKFEYITFPAGEEEGKKPKRAVGFKLSAGMEIPQELEGKFKFARQRSKLAGEIRGSFFVLKQEWV